MVSLFSFFPPFDNLKKLEKYSLATESGHEPKYRPEECPKVRCHRRDSATQTPYPGLTRGITRGYFHTRDNP